MSGHKPWNEISAELLADPERRARIEQREQAIEAELTISQLREARGATDTFIQMPSRDSTQIDLGSLDQSKQESSCLLYRAEWSS